MGAGERYEFTSRRIRRKTDGEEGIVWTIDHAERRVWVSLGSSRMARAPSAPAPLARWLPLDDVEFVDE